MYHNLISGLNTLLSLDGGNSELATMTKYIKDIKRVVISYENYQTSFR